MHKHRAVTCHSPALNQPNIILIDIKSESSLALIEIRVEVHLTENDAAWEGEQAGS